MLSGTTSIQAQIHTTNFKPLDELFSFYSLFSLSHVYFAIDLIAASLKFVGFRVMLHSTALKLNDVDWCD